MNRSISLKEIIDWVNIEDILVEILNKIHTEWPILNEDFEKISYIKKFHYDIFSKYENRLIYLLWLFYKTSEPKNIIEKVYSLFWDFIKEDSWWKDFTPFQYDAYKKISEKTYFSFSAPTSAWKSFLFREIILDTKGDIIIVVPSRALIAEYMFKVKEIIKWNKSILLLPFLDDVNKKNTNQRIYIITPERWIELFKLKDTLKIELFLFDEAQVSEEKIRWMQFDAFVRRSDKIFPSAKKIFAHPFINNPNAQLIKHKFDITQSIAQNYKQITVWKIYIVNNWWNFYYFSPYDKNKPRKKEKIICDYNIIQEILTKNWIILIYITKEDIYKWSFIEKYNNIISTLPEINNSLALNYIEKLNDFIWAWHNFDDYSFMIEMMKKWIAIHHWSIPLKARYIIEEFINKWYARICFSTATLLQWINMPFDAVWIDNFRFEWDNEDQKTLNFKNLIWRAWRNKNNSNAKFDYWYVIIEEKNLKKFSERLIKNITISSSSKLDEDDNKNIPEDNKDIYDAFKKDWFNDELFLPNNQINRIKEVNIDDDISIILNSLLDENNIPIKWKKYQLLDEKSRKIIKKSFEKIYLSHLRRDKLKEWERAILSASIPMLLWRIQWKTFKEILWLRKAYITKKDDQIEIKKDYKSWIISFEEMKEKINNIKLEYSQKADNLPNINLIKSFPLFKLDSKLSDFKYDILVYDTYDYLDKVITFSIINPLAAAFNIYYKSYNDIRAKIMENYIRFWTNDYTEIMLLRYWFTFEEIEKIKNFIEKIDENEIVFNKEKLNTNEDLKEIVERYY